MPKIWKNFAECCGQVGKLPIEYTHRARNNKRLGVKTMKATATINRRAVEFTVTEVATGDALRADLVARGFDGTVWTGVAPATARRGEKHGLFYRTQAGQFVAGVIL